MIIQRHGIHIVIFVDTWPPRSILLNNYGKWYKMQTYTFPRQNSTYDYWKLMLHFWFSGLQHLQSNIGGNIKASTYSLLHIFAVNLIEIKLTSISFIETRKLSLKNLTWILSNVVTSGPYLVTTTYKQEITAIGSMRRVITRLDVNTLRKHNVLADIFKHI